MFERNRGAEIDAYLRVHSRGLRGWLSPRDGWAIELCSNLQRAAGIEGDLLEIGAFEGRSTVLLGYLRASGEKLLVCDPFDSLQDDVEKEVRDSYAGLAQTTFDENFRRFHPDGCELFVGTSDALPEYAGDRMFRLVHVDGSHEYSVVQADIEWCRQHLTPGGAIVFDDVGTRHLPGVAAAVWGAVERGELRPIAFTTKLYCVLPDDEKASWADGFADAVASHRWLKSKTENVGSAPVQVLHLEEDPAPMGDRLRRLVVPAGVEALRRRLGSLLR